VRGLLTGERHRWPRRGLLLLRLLLLLWLLLLLLLLLRLLLLLLRLRLLRLLLLRLLVLVREAGECQAAATAVSALLRRAVQLLRERCGLPAAAAGQLCVRQALLLQRWQLQ
jgi:hypothetical protein